MFLTFEDPCRVLVNPGIHLDGSLMSEKCLQCPVDLVVGLAD